MHKKIVTIPPSACGMKLSDYLVREGEQIALVCGGAGTCGKCRVKLLSGHFDGVLPDDAQTILACRAICTAEEAKIEMTVSEGDGLATFSIDTTAKPTTEKGLGVAVDIGTTTLACAYVDRASGAMLATASCLNPQQRFGADVMSRIVSSEEHLDAMQKDVCKAIADLCNELLPAANGAPISAMTVVGNPTMLHLFCGISPAGMGQSPFTPVFIEEKTMAGNDLDLPVETVTILPSASAFIGSDIIAGVLASGMTDKSRASILMDIGTNGEMVLTTGIPSELFAASTAAGPALEGAGITCGVGGVDGAICKVWLEEDALQFETINNAPPVGICGSGLIDLIACLLEQEIIDETGYMEEDVLICPSVYLTPADVRKFQLAKSAIRAGFEALLDTCNLKADDIDTIYLAGGLGFYMNPKSAAAVGLIPKELESRVRAIGNSALGGAVLSLSDPQQLKKVTEIADACKTIELNSSQVFHDAFMEHMFF